jgi:hypothetical protein
MIDFDPPPHANAQVMLSDNRGTCACLASWTHYPIRLIFFGTRAPGVDALREQQRSSARSISVLRVQSMRVKAFAFMV